MHLFETTPVMLLIQESSSGSLSISINSEIFGSGEFESERYSLFSIWLHKSSETGEFMSILSVALMAYLGAHKGGSHSEGRPSFRSDSLSISLHYVEPCLTKELQSSS